jgi:hypothetical protein
MSLPDADVLRKVFADVNAVVLNGNFYRKALSARREDLQNVIPTVEVCVDKAPPRVRIPWIVM